MDVNDGRKVSPQRLTNASVIKSSSKKHMENRKRILGIPEELLDESVVKEKIEMEARAKRAIDKLNRSV